MLCELFMCRYQLTTDQKLLAWGPRKTLTWYKTLWAQLRGRSTPRPKLQLWATPTRHVANAPANAIWLLSVAQPDVLSTSDGVARPTATSGLAAPATTFQFSACTTSKHSCCSTKASQGICHWGLALLLWFSPSLWGWSRLLVTCKTIQNRRV